MENIIKDQIKKSLSGAELFFGVTYGKEGVSIMVIGICPGNKLPIILNLRRLADNMEKDFFKQNAEYQRKHTREE